MNADRTVYNEVIGYTEDGSAVILNDTFRYPDGFHGATGAVVELISKERYAELTTMDSLMEYWEDVFADLKRRAQLGQHLTLRSWVRSLGAEAKEAMFDSSYREYIPGGAHVTTNCIGGGRIFPRVLGELVTVTRPDLVEVIKEAEAGNPE